MTQKLGLVLSGGGARGAYQVGVLKAIADMHVKHAANPFSIISGTSSGALNAVALAASANNFRLAVKKVEKLWMGLHAGRVYRASPWAVSLGMLRILFSLLNQGTGRSRPLALLDNEPLRELLLSSIKFKNIRKRIEAGYLDAVVVNATGYSSGENVSFFEGRPDLTTWRRGRRVGMRVQMGIEHLMASSAIPLLFPAQLVSREYFGDGALRQLTPVSPALRLGADRVLVVGVSGNAKHQWRQEYAQHSPSMAQLVGHLYNSAFIDSLEHDLDIMQRFNDLIALTQNEAPHTSLGEMRVVNLMCITPTIEFDEVAQRHVNRLPWGMRNLLRRVGATGGGGASFASYLLFEPSFCKELIEHGYRDAMQQKDAIAAFFRDEVLPPVTLL